MALDPRSVEAQSLLAIVLVDRVLDEMTDTEAADIAHAQELVGQALAASPGSPYAHFANGQLLRLQHRCKEAISEFEAALAHWRNYPWVFAHIGNCKIKIGQVEAAIPLEEQAIRLSPRDPNIAYFYFWIGQAHLLQSRTDEAIVWLGKARSANPSLVYVHRYLASAYGLKGDSEHAAAELAEVRRLTGNGPPITIARMRALAAKFYEVPATRDLFEATYLAGLRKAGVPEN